MLYFYLATYPLLLVAHLKSERKVLKVIAFAAQYGIQLILLFFVLINPWCRYYYFRYIVATPDSSYYSDSYTQPTQAPANNSSGNIDNSTYSDSNSTSGNGSLLLL
jgi:hypothetical protein